MTTITAWHASAEPRLVIRAGLHVGTPEQARMRGARHLHRIVLDVRGRIPRIRDRGSWDDRNLRRLARTAAVAVYLNRHEGIPMEEFDRARPLMDLDGAPDGVFRRLVPSSADSWIVLDPSIVASVERVVGERPGA